MRIKSLIDNKTVGRLNTKGDWQEDPSAMLKVTIGCQLEILMIVEALILKGFRVVSVNTDGWDCIVEREREDEFKEICFYYEEFIGNKELGNIEYTEFKWIAQTSVNDYIALKSDGNIKKKGEFTTDFELHKNKSARIVPLALEQYFLNNVPVNIFIMGYSDIYSFCIRQKSSKCFHYEGTNKETGKKTIYDKLIRYYVSNSGEKIHKIKNVTCDTNAPEKSQVEAGEWLCTICNHLPKGTRVEDCDINYNYYIERAERIIKRIRKSYKSVKIEKNQQLSLW